MALILLSFILPPSCHRSDLLGPNLPYKPYSAGNSRAVDVPSMCNYFKNYYIYSSCSQPDSHILRTSLDGSKESRCSDSPHDRFIVVVGRCHLCTRWNFYFRLSFVMLPRQQQRFHLPFGWIRLYASSSLWQSVSSILLVQSDFTTRELWYTPMIKRMSVCSLLFLRYLFIPGCVVHYFGFYFFGVDGLC